MHRVYGKPGQVLTSVFTILVSTGSVGSQIFAFGHVLNSIFEIPLLLSSAIGAFIILSYSSFGGIKSVVFTDVFQYLFIIVCIPLLFIVSVYYADFSSLGFGINNLFYSHVEYGENTVKYSSLFIILLFSSLDPSYIQRLLISKNTEQAIKSNTYSGYMSLVHFTLIGIIGICLHNILPNIDSQIALTFFINKFLIVGLKGLIICSFLAAVMSSADSDLHIIGVTFVSDIMGYLCGSMSERVKIKYARISTFAIGLVSFYIAHSFDNIIDIMSYAFSFWMPTILIPFVLALYGKTFGNGIFLIGVILSSLVTFWWNSFLDSQIEGAIIGAVIHILFLIYINNKYAAKPKF